MKNRQNINKTRQNSEQFTRSGNMMSRGVSRKGSKGQQQKATINGSLNKTGANITDCFPRPDFAGVQREFLAAGSAGPNSLPPEITFCNGSEKWKRTFN